MYGDQRTTAEGGVRDIEVEVEPLLTDTLYLHIANTSTKRTLSWQVGARTKEGQMYMNSSYAGTKSTVRNMEVSFL